MKDNQSIFVCFCNVKVVSTLLGEKTSCFEAKHKKFVVVVFVVIVINGIVDRFFQISFQRSFMREYFFDVLYSFGFELWVWKVI